jgi:hypothetical protein
LIDQLRIILDIRPKVHYKRLFEIGGAALDKKLDLENILKLVQQEDNGVIDLDQEELS